jgi:hypothetical protein
MDMRKFLLPLVGLLSLVSAAWAVTGTPPGTGESLIDGRWLNALAGGVNYSFASGIAAAGTTQATSTPLPTMARLISVDTVAASAGVSLPPAIAGTQISLYNGSANTLTIYPSIINNPKTGVQDTIDTTLSSTTIGTHSHAFMFCAKTGNWSF